MHHSRLFIVFFFFFAATQLAAKTNVTLLDKIIVVVNDDVITQIELNDRVQLISKQLQQQGQRLPDNNLLNKQILERLVIEKIQLKMAAETGIRVTDDIVNRVIANIAQENNLSMEKFREVLSNDGFKFSDFRENIRREVTISRLRKVRVENKVSVTEQEINNYLSRIVADKSANDEFLLSHILIATPEAANSEQIAAAKQKAETVLSELRADADFSQKAIAVSNDELALKGGNLGWRKLAQLPNLISSSIVKMKKGSIKGPLRSASGFHIIKLNDKRSNTQKSIVSQTKTRHILIRPTQVLSREEARSRLETILERIKKGEDFASIARASSDDKAAAAEGGSLGWVSPGKMVPAFEEQMNALKIGEISEPFLTQFGWHIAQVLARRQHDNTKNLQRSQAINLIRKRKTEEATQDWLRRLRAEAYVDYRINK